MKAGSFVIERIEIEGWMLLVPQSYIDATEEQIDEKTGGCGPGSIGDWFVPDTILGESVFLACRIHDWMYGEGTSIEDKKIADRVFLWNMTVLIQEAPFTQEQESAALDLVRLRTCMTYYSAVSYGGNDAFDRGESMKGNEVDL